MPHVDPERRREHNRRYYHESSGKTRVMERNKANKERNRKFVNELKEKPCTDCKIQYPCYIMQFDHLKDKVDSLSAMVNAGSSLARLQKEIDKCELVCANCHCIRTWQRRQPDLGCIA